MALDANAKGGSKFDAILNRTEVGVGRVMPLLGQRFGDGHATRHGELPSHTPVTEIGNRDHRAASNSQVFSEDVPGPADLLQRLTEVGIVK